MRLKCLNRLGALGILQIFVGAPCQADEAIRFSPRMENIIDAVLANHIDPPTKQQMLLFGAKSVYTHVSKPMPAGLSGKISQLATPDQVDGYLLSIRSDFPNVEHLDEVFARGIFNAVPGGGFLSQANEAKVAAQLTANRYVGIGIALSLDDKKSPTISEVIYDGPAWHAGLKANDTIQEIDGQSTTGERPEADCR